MGWGGGAEKKKDKEEERKEERNGGKKPGQGRGAITVHNVTNLASAGGDNHLT